MVRIRGTSEGSETLELGYSTRRIWIWPVYFCLGIILKVIQYNFQNNVFTKVDHSDLNSPRRELSNGGLKNVAALLVLRQIDFSCASTGDPIQLYAFKRRIQPPPPNQPPIQVLKHVCGLINFFLFWGPVLVKKQKKRYFPYLSFHRTDFLNSKCITYSLSSKWFFLLRSKIIA